jgi:hypothetical protein
MKRASLLLAAIVLVALAFTVGRYWNEGDARAASSTPTLDEQRVSFPQRYHTFLSEQAPPVSDFCVAHDFYNRFAQLVPSWYATENTEKSLVISGAFVDSYGDISRYQIQGEYERRKLVFAAGLRAFLSSHPNEALPDCTGSDEIGNIHTIYEDEAGRTQKERSIDRALVIQIARSEISGRLPDTDVTVPNRIAMFKSAEWEIARNGKDQIGYYIERFNLNEVELQQCGITNKADRQRFADLLKYSK